MNEERVNIWQCLGVGILVLTVGMPAMQRAGFVSLFEVCNGWSLPMCLAVATFGGAIGGALLGEQHYIAGLLGGLVAGPTAFLAMYFYALQRESMWNYEAVLVQLVGSLPGIGLFYVLKRLGPPEPATNEGELAYAEEQTA